MVEFRFDIRPLFEQSIIKVTSNLLPHTFRGDRRQCLDATSKMSEVIDRLGLLSAHAQKLNKPVTTAQRLRMSENQVIYIMADVTDGNNGKVLGLLKVGTKDLYLFDETGRTRKVPNAPSILDFYIHESRQRSGLGKELFETMLADEGWTPIKCSIDRPSEKLLAFFKKHYGLVRVIPQANNFVLYEGFFDPDDTDNNKNIDKQEQLNQKASNGSMMHITNSPNTQLFGATYFDNDDDYNKKRRSRHLDTPSNNITAQMAQLAQIAPAGRYGARRPTCSMAEKTTSEVSMTPSQVSEMAKQNARKNPLDALSKNTSKPTIERRSGLQDVDEEYLKQNIFRKPRFNRHSGLNETGDATNQIHNLPAAGQPSIPNQQHGDGLPVTQSQAQVDAQQQQQQQQYSHHHHHHQHPHQQQYHHTQMPTAAGGGGHHIHHGKNPIMNHQHQAPPSQAAAASAAPSMSQVEPEMCTTCPNCQTTIYLVRGTDMTPRGPPQSQSPPVSMMPNNQPNNSVPMQQQQQQQQQQMPPNDNIPPNSAPPAAAAAAATPIIHNGPPPTKSGAATSSSVSVLAASTSTSTITPTVNHKNNLTIINNLTENFQNVSINASGEQEIEGNEENREDYEEEGVKESNMDNGHYGFNNDEQQEELPIEQTVDGTIQFDPATDLMMNNETVTHDDSVIPERNIIQNTTPTRYQNSLTIGAAESGRAPRGHRSPTSASVIGNGVLRKPPPTFQLSKQHTGMKNRSDGVGMAVTPTNKMEFVQENREEFGVLKIHRPIGHKPALSPSALTSSKRLSPNNHHYNYNNNNHNDNNNNNHEESDDAVSTASSKEEGALTQQGYYDMKFFHNKLW